jgi:hypothetical protein
MVTVVATVLLTLASAAGPSGADTNPLLGEVLQKGVAMPDGSAIPLPAPTMADGMDAATQSKALARVLPPRVSLEQFTMQSSSAPINVKVRTFKGKNDATYRAVDLWFVVHGDWETLISKKFGDSMSEKRQLPPKPGQEQPGTLKKSGFLTEAEMQDRDLSMTSKSGQEERYFYTTFTLFDRVELSATRYAVLTRTPASIVLAAKVDPRFAKDKEYPNQWQSVERDAAAKLVYGPKQPYSGAGFYLKVTKLSKPAGTIFIEYHSVFHEPEGWFGGENLLRAKLPSIAEFQVKEFRRKLATASQESTAEKP